MKLPFVIEAEVPEAKIVLYLLNPHHGDGKSKARFFSARGFQVKQWKELADTLRRHALEHEVAQQINTVLGIRFVVEGMMTMPDETVALIRSVWFIESGERVPRFVTAYPLRHKKRI
ncbi:MAG TPA: hypothetical protein VGI03_12985 [Verrucomicrobiae bacterium]